MAKTKKLTKNETAIAWLTAEGYKAMQRKDKAVVKIIGDILKTMQQPDYMAELIKINKHMQKHGSMDYGYFRQNIPNPNAKPKTINHK